MTSDTDSKKSASLGIGITEKGQQVVMIGTETKDEKKLLLLDGNSQLGRLVGLAGILSSLPELSIPTKPRRDIIKSHKLLPLNFSKCLCL